MTKRKEFMGKIRVKTLGIEEAEKKQKQEAKKKAENKKLVKGAKGGERIVAVGPSDEELAKLESPVIVSEAKSDLAKAKQSQDGIAASSRSVDMNMTPRNDKVRKGKVSKSKRAVSKRSRSKNYQAVAKLVDRNKTYPLLDALILLKKLKTAKFDETVELHINTLGNKITATATLPHGTGKKTRVAIADDKIIENVAKGKIDFDILLAEPSIMPKLARVAKFLGPRGLMPNPKNGTITTNPKELAKKYEGGQVTFKTESKAPIMHVAVGKLSFGEKKLSQNIQAVFAAVKPESIKNVTLKSTMSPGIKIQLD